MANCIMCDNEEEAELKVTIPTSYVNCNSCKAQAHIECAELIAPDLYLCLACFEYGDNE